MTRRQFVLAMTYASLFSSATVQASTAEAAPEGEGERAYRGFTSDDPRGQTKRIPILQGLTTETTAQFTVLRNKARDRWAYEVIDSEGRRPAALARQTIERTYSEWCIDKLVVEGLFLGSPFYFRVIDEVTGRMLDQRFFRTLDRGRRDVRFAMASCMSDDLRYFQKKTWRSLQGAAPDVVFFVGDAVYADLHSDGSEASIWRRYVETRRTLEIFKYETLTPILATWDDHDYGLNNSDSRYPLKDKTRRIFFAFFGSYEGSGYQHGPGVSSLFEGFGQRFFFMDDRTFRSPSGSGGSHWGEEQEDWLFDELKRSPEPAWILNGSQFFGAYLEKESYGTCHKESFASIMNRFGEARIPVVFGSGDVHFSEIMRIEPEILGYTTYELTSSSMHSGTYPGKHLRKRNPRRLNATWRHNFLLVESRSDGLNLELIVTSIGADHQRLFRRHVHVTAPSPAAPSPAAPGIAVPSPTAPSVRPHRV